MKAGIRLIVVLVTCAQGVVALGQQEGTVAVVRARELIEQAHRYDRAYNAGPEADRRQAIRYYLAALDADPTREERLHALFRLAQLHGVCYQAAKGEKPDYRKAISLYEQIVAEYPPEDPMVLRAMIGLCDHHTSLGQYEEALRWSKKVIQVDTSKLEEQLRAAEEASDFAEHDPPPEPNEVAGLAREYGGLKQAQRQIELCKQAAVDQIAYTMRLVDPLLAQVELKRLIREHEGTGIADRAQRRLDESIDRMSEVYRPDLGGPGSGDDLMLEVGMAPASGVSNGGTELPAGAELSGTTEDPVQSRHRPTVSDRALPHNEHAEEAPRAPPRRRRASIIAVILAAGIGLCTLSLAAIRRRKLS